MNFLQTDIPLAEDDWIFTFLIDGDKKWIGTRRSGLYLLEDGKLTHHPFGKRPNADDFIIPAVSSANYICETTGISTTSATTPMNKNIYNLQGQRLSSEPKCGIFIKNGKKIGKR